jgi:uncharacterized protein YyaL (SSP411 family)
MGKRQFVCLTVVLVVVIFNYVYGVDNMNKNKQRDKTSNNLINESSPYLLQHAYNPVNWYPWGKRALERAKTDNKLLVISIGYAACHWCHVMEKESFEDELVAKVMNENFVSIKVDREERPDIDQVYMNAAQLLTGSGGWPLNVIALPDGRPVYVGTYFPKEAWISVLTQLSKIYKKDPEKLIHQAQAITNGIKASEVVRLNIHKVDLIPTDLNKLFSKWFERLDLQYGGLKGAPKFPLPVGYQFLLKYYAMTRERNALQSLKISLDNMAFGGIYDHIGGGFARYSTDSYWKIPHFEKMLYDNAQLVSLYSAAYQLTKNPLYKNVVYQTLDFVQRELTSPQLGGKGIGFYSSLDADSEGEEGKYYIWTRNEIQTILGEETELFCDYYSVSKGGNWHKGYNILYRKKTDKEYAKEKKISIKSLSERINKAREKLLITRLKRIRPALDDKILTSWNALMLKGFLDAYRVFDEDSYLEVALNNAHFLDNRILQPDGRLFRNFKGNKSSINGFLDDYAFIIQAFISLYQATFAEKWLYKAETLLKYTLNHFFDKRSNMFFYTSDLDPELIARKMEVTDNVIPASNSTMAMNLYLLGQYLFKEDYIKKSEQMLSNVKSDLMANVTYFGNWGILMSHFIENPYEVAITGEDCFEKRKELDEHYLPNVILMGGKKAGTLPLLKGKFINGQTTIFVCKEKACRLPVTEVREALKQIN